MVAEYLKVTLYMFRLKSNKLCHHVIHLIAYQRPHIVRTDIRLNGLYAGRNIVITQTTVQ